MTPSATATNASPATILTASAIAIICHEANRAYCEVLGDTSQMPWIDAPQWQRESAIQGVVFNLTHPDAPPSASHDSWMTQKTQEGWKYGPSKDPEKKEHPCYVPYEKLPPAQQAKDHLFKSIVAGLAPFVDRENFQIF